MDILYKYVTPERALTCIPEVGDGTLRATQPAALNDPFECAAVPAYFLGEEDENTVLAEIITNLNEYNPISAEVVRLARKNSRRLFVQKLVTDQLSARYGVVSLTALPCHPLMWSHYAADEVDPIVRTAQGLS